jgi:transposase-like protein
VSLKYFDEVDVKGKNVIEAYCVVSGLPITQADINYGVVEQIDGESYYIHFSERSKSLMKNNRVLKSVKEAEDWLRKGRGNSLLNFEDYLKELSEKNGVSIDDIKYMLKAWESFVICSNTGRGNFQETTE